MLKGILSKILILIFIVVSCASPTNPNGNENSLTVTGTIENLNGTTLTENMKVYVFWRVTSGSPDYTYVWGKGSIDKSNMTFEVNLKDKPPTAALNIGSLGVGIIAIIDDNALQNGILPTDYPTEKMIGIAGWNSVIFKADTSMDSSIDWLKRFNTGYDTGIGVDEEGIFDSFKPTDKNSIKIIIDAMGNIRVVNWT